MRIWQRKLLYNYFPFVTFIMCILTELVLAAASPIGIWFRGKIIFDLWPLLLLIWIIYWTIKWPACTKQIYFLFVVLVFGLLFLAVTSTLIVSVFDLSISAQAFLRRHLGTALIGLFFILAIYQIFARWHWKENHK
jgi:hypothetical protein